MSSAPPEGRSEYPVLERYELLSQIGQGGMGTVYLARHTGLGKIVAVKILPARMMQDAKAVARFEREMKAVGLLDHENIVVATDGGESGSSRFLAMEFVDGLDLSRLVGRTGPLRVADACEILRQAAMGLQHAYEHGLLHRDIKPSNLMLTKQGCVKVLDLGLARLHRETAGELSITDSGEIMGTPDYMSPEQATNSTQIDIRADIYALGCSFYNLLTGRAPFGGSRYPTPLKKLMAHVRSQPLPVEAQRTDVPPGVRDVLARMLSKSPADRYAIPIHLATALEPWCAGADLPALLNQAETLPDGAAPTESLSQKTKLLKPSSNGTPESSNRWPRRIGLVGVLAVIFVVGGWLVAKTLTQPHGPVAESSPDASNPKHESAASAAQGTAGTSTSSTVPSETTPTGWHGWPADAPPPAIAPFNAQQAQQHQEAWAKYLKVPVEYTNSIGLKLKLIPPGEFLIGATQAEVNANIESYDKAIQSDPLMFSPAYRDLVQGHIRGAMPRHKVVLTQPLYLGEHEVTQAEFELVLGHNPSNFAPTGSRKDFVVGLDTTEHPVEMVSWADAAEFCAKLSQREQLQPYYLRMRGRESVTGLDGTGYRLPTEAEWESACRAGTTTSSWIGDPPATLESVAWHAANSGQRTHPVGLLKANPFGLFDVLGNLSEWVEDGFDPLSYQQHRDNLAINPNAPASDATQYVIRGHNWWEPAWNCTAWKRAPIWKDHFPRCENVGFRVALPVSAVKPADKANEATTLENPTNAPAKPVKKERGKPIGNLDTPKFHREMAESILRRGGFISVVGPNDSVEWAPHPLNADAILTTPQFKSVDELPGSDFMLSGAHLGPAQENDVDVLASFSSLRLLSFGKVSISDKNMRRLAELPQLRVLVLIDCKATETGTIELKRSKSIEYLDLGLIPLNDDILPALGEMHQLIYLSLHGTLVTDDRLDELQELRALKNLLLGNTNVTATGCARMRQMLPTCKVQGK